MPTQSTTKYKQWSVVLVNYPFTSSESEYKRPALIISPDEFNKRDRVVILQITSNVEENSGCMLENWEEAGLLKPSIVNMRFATIKKSVIVKKLGNLTQRDIAEVEEYL